MNEKLLQHFNDDYLKACKGMSPLQVLKFLEDYKKLHFKKTKAKSKLISIKVPQDLLAAFKVRAELEGIPYQTLIKKLMRDFL